MSDWPAYRLEEILKKYVHDYHRDLQLPLYFFKDLVQTVFGEVAFDDHAWIVAKTSGEWER